MAVTKSGDIGYRTAGHAKAQLLARAQTLLHLERFGQVDPLGKGKSDTVTYRGYNAIEPATAPLAEGVTPPGKKLTCRDIVATLQMYGDLIEITRQIEDFHEDPVLKEAMSILGQSAAETIEIVRFSHLKAGSNVYYGNGVASRSLVTSPLTLNDLHKIERQFRRNRAEKITEIVSATPNVSTEPIPAAFFILAHSDCAYDIKRLEGWIPVANYSQTTKAMPGEEGSVGSFRFILSDLYESWQAAGVAGTDYLSGGDKVSGATACDVYPMLVFGKNAYGIVPFQDRKSVDLTVLNPSTKDHANPMGLKGSASYTTYQTVAILQDLFMARVEVAATAL
jgi:N4-gp56 family major capsid protein